MNNICSRRQLLLGMAALTLAACGPAQPANPPAAESGITIVGEQADASTATSADATNLNVFVQFGTET